MKRAFRGVWIPAEIWLSKELTLQEKVFFAEIDSLNNDDGCYASNQYFSDFFGLSKNRCSEIIKSLEKKGLISIEYEREENKKNIKRRVIKVFGKSNRGIREIEEGYSENREENNTCINNKYIYTIFEHWNSKNIIKHRKVNKTMESHINARLEEYSLEELLKAIDNYKEVLSNDRYYWTYKWTLQDFMKPNNIVRFLDDSNPFDSFLKTEYSNVVRFEKPDPVPYGRIIPRGFDYEKAKTAGEDPDWWRR